VPFILLPALVALVVLPVSGTWSLVAALTAGFCIFFFRDPERSCGAPPDAVAAPADGRVVAVQELDGRPQIAIFLSVLDVHVNRSPCAGTVETVSHRPGRFLVAWDPRASTANEQTRLQLETDRGLVEVKQIAGVLARRIICRVGPGDTLQRGSRFGMIRFGSRVELTLPAGSRVATSVGDRVRAGETVIAQLPSPRPEEQA
jgi:phosphatidylserine decarboxylase